MKKSHSGSNQSGIVTTAVMLAATVIMLMTLLLPSVAAAHGPSEVTLSYDGEAETLSTTIVHSVGNPEAHYISEVVIAINGAEEAHAYTSQPHPSTFTYTYSLKANPGDVVEVTVRCNRFGSGNASLTIP